MSRYEQAIERNLAELQRAILNRITLVGLEAAAPLTRDFLKLTYYAFFNDYVAHSIKVFDRNKQSTSFWYIHRTNAKPVSAAARKHAVSLSALSDVSDKLKKIRDRTHFHIDSQGVLDPQAIWRDADLRGKELAQAVDGAWLILLDLAG